MSEENKETDAKLPLKFIHLRIHTDFSLINGLDHVETFCKLAGNESWPALAITDYMNVCGLVRQYEICAKDGVKPIAAVDLNVYDKKTNDVTLITCYAMNEQGYHNICEVMSRAYRRGYLEKFFVPAIELEWFEERNSYDTCFLNEGIIVLLGGRFGAIGKALLTNNQEEVDRLIAFYNKNFPQRAYLELVRTKRPQEEEYILKAVELSEKTDIPVVATNDVMFIKKDEFDYHEIRVAIQQKTRLGDPSRPKIYSAEQYLKSQEEMYELFKDIPEALANTIEIAKRCNVYITLGTLRLPNFPVPKDFKASDELKNRVQDIYNKRDLKNIFADLKKMKKVIEDDPSKIKLGKIDKRSDEEKETEKELAAYLIWMSETGLEERLKLIYPDEEERNRERGEFDERLKMELNVIISMGFPGYFLIVMEFIQWSKANHIPIGPGRGSGAGSLVAYSIKITDINPLKFALLFERFLNPERVSMPDFDIDICMDRRGEVIEHVAKTYGHDAVSQIITFGSMAAKAAIKDVARVLNLSYTFADEVAKLIPAVPGATIDYALGRVFKDGKLKNPELLSQDLVDRYEKEEDVHSLIDTAIHLEGVYKSTGKHAGGVVISPTKIVDYSPLSCAEDGSEPVTQYDKHDIENAGLVKFDFLGLKTLTIIQWAVDMINEKLAKQGKPPVDINNIPLDDKASFDMLLACETTAVFQLESAGMRGLIGKLKPDVFEDMIALVALFRPGPLDSGMVDNFINRKHGVEEIAYPMPEYQHECLKPILEPTYGVVVYQEQVMQLAQALSGYTLGGADMLRRAMGKKIPEEMVRHRAIFVEGAVKLGRDADIAGKIYDIVEKFAGYGFNKSHSAAYAFVAYQTLWLKTHYPAEYLAAIMTGDCGNKEKIVAYVAELNRLGLKIIPPDVNTCDYNFTVNSKGEVVYGMCAINGVGNRPIEEIMRVRKNGPFLDLFDFCARVDLKLFSKGLLETLIWVGAFDNLGPHRGALIDALGDALDYAESRHKDISSGQGDLFADAEGGDPYRPTFKSVPQLPDKVWLEKEKEYLGLYLTGHPIEQYADEIKKYPTTKIKDLLPGGYQERNKVYTTIGYIIESKTFFTKSGKRMGVIKLVDKTGEIEVVGFGETVEKYMHLFKTDTVVMVRGNLKTSFKQPELYNLMANEIISITEARIKYAKFILVKIYEEKVNNVMMKELHNVLENHRHNDFSIKMCYYTDKSCIMMNRRDEIGVLPTDDLLNDLRLVVGKNNVSIEF